MKSRLPTKPSGVSSTTNTTTNTTTNNTTTTVSAHAYTAVTASFHQ